MKLVMKNSLIGGLLILLLQAPLFAEKESWIRNVKAIGTWDITGNTSFNEAKENALFEAKKNALREAGVSTSIQSVSFSSVTQDGENYGNELFNQINSFYISGRVKIKKEPVVEQTIENNILRLKVSIVADVLKDNPSDPEFQIMVKGIEKSYKEGTPVKFSIKSSKDCFIRIFWFDNSIKGSGFILYPLSGYDTDTPLKKNTEYSFPRSEDFDYTTTLTSGADLEQTFLFIVATKQQIPYLEEEVSFEKFFKWYYSIDSKDKTKYYPFGFSIYR